jgi:hypothetical protein
MIKNLIAFKRFFQVSNLVAIDNLPRHTSRLGCH